MTTSSHLGSLRLAWLGIWHKLGPASRSQDCNHLRRAWWHLRFLPASVRLEGRRYCVNQCLEAALTEILSRTRAFSKSASWSHRVPLGLLLLSRQQLTPEQLETALAAQRSEGHGRIGEWLQSLGFVTEQQVTAALAQQWACPVLNARSLPHVRYTPQLPTRLLEDFAMVPLAYTQSSSTLHVAFSETIDYNVLYSLQQMLGCRTEACLAAPSFVRAELAVLSNPHEEREIAFDHAADYDEISRIVRSYCNRLGVAEIRLVRCGDHIWVRLLRPSLPPFDLLLRASHPSAIQFLAARQPKVRASAADIC